MEALAIPFRHQMDSGACARFHAAQGRGSLGTLSVLAGGAGIDQGIARPGTSQSVGARMQACSPHQSLMHVFQPVWCWHAEATGEPCPMEWLASLSCAGGLALHRNLQASSATIPLCMCHPGRALTKSFRTHRLYVGVRPPNLGEIRRDPSRQQRCLFFAHTSGAEHLRRCPQVRPACRKLFCGAGSLRRRGVRHVASLEERMRACPSHRRSPLRFRRGGLGVVFVHRGRGGPIERQVTL